MANELPPADFAHQIAPVLKEFCGDCHTGGKKKGGFSLNTHASFLAGGENGQVFNAAHPEQSRLLEVLFSTDPDVVMPPREKGRKVPTAEQMALLKKWVLAGARWEEGYAFQKATYHAPVKPRLPELPPVVTGKDHPIDRLLAAYNASHGFTAPKVVDDAAFARRVHLDLLGILPAPEALTAFVQDGRPNKREALVDALLARKTDYADHWMTFWNDLLRNDYGGTGFITGGRKQVSTWLYQSLADNIPYDRMVRELVNPTAETEGFAQGITWRGTVSASQTREVQFSQSVSQAFLGLNFKCASCHDSFIDDWKLSDAYGLAAIFSENPIEMARCEKPTGITAKPSWPFPELGQIDAKANRVERLRQLAELMTHPENGWFARTMANRLWAALLGRGLVHPVDAMGTQPWSEEILDYLGWYFAQHAFDVKAVLKLITTSQAYQSESVPRSKEDGTAPYVFYGPRARRMSAEQFVDAVWHLTGTSPARCDAPVRREEPSADKVAAEPWTAQWIFAEPPVPDSATPKAKPSPVVMAKTWTLPAKPVKAAGIVVGPTGARVFVNGAEIKGAQVVRFGTVNELRLDGVLAQGENTIAVEVPAGAKDPESASVLLSLGLAFGNGTKQTLVSDEEWRVSHGFTAEQVKGGKLAAKFPEFQAATWTPVKQVGESDVKVRERSSLKRDFVWALQPQPPARASLMKADLLMRTLGRPNRDQIVTSRPQDLSTLEALDLSAGERLNDILSKGATRVLARGFADSPSLVKWVYQSALSRGPQPQEEAAALELLGAKPSAAEVSDFLWAVCVLPEFQLVR